MRAKWKGLDGTQRALAVIVVLQGVGLALLLSLIFANTARVEAERQAVIGSCHRANRYFRRTINQNIVRPMIDFASNILETRRQEAMVSQELARVATALGAPSAGALFHHSAIIYRGAVHRDTRNIKEFDTVPYARCENAFGTPPHPPYLRHAPLPRARHFHIKPSSSPPPNARRALPPSAPQAASNAATAPPPGLPPAVPSAGATTSSSPTTSPSGRGSGGEGSGGNPGGGGVQPPPTPPPPTPNPPPAPKPTCVVNALGVRVCIPAL